MEENNFDSELIHAEWLKNHFNYKVLLEMISRHIEEMSDDTKHQEYIGKLCAYKKILESLLITEKQLDVYIKQLEETNPNFVARISGKIG